MIAATGNTVCVDKTFESIARGTGLLWAAVCSIINEAKWLTCLMVRLLQFLLVVAIVCVMALGLTNPSHDTHMTELRSKAEGQLLENCTFNNYIICSVVSHGDRVLSIGVLRNVMLNDNPKSLIRVYTGNRGPVRILSNE